MLMGSPWPSLARTLTKTIVIFCNNAQNLQFSRQHAPPDKVKITSSAASDLKISHRLIHWLNRGEQASDCAKIDPVGVTAT